MQVNPRYWSCLLCLPLVVMLALLLLWPMLSLVKESFVDEDLAWATLKHYSSILTDAHRRQAMFVSIALSALVAFLSTVLCLGPAWMLSQHQFLGKKLMRMVLVLPMAFSGVIIGFLMVLLLGRAGWIPKMTERYLGESYGAGLSYTFMGLLIAYLYFEIPRATLTLEAALKHFNTQYLSAARSLGASTWQTILWVLLPNLWPAMLSTFAVTFSVSLGSFGVILVMSTRQYSVIPLEIFMGYTGFPADPHGAAAMSVALMLVALVINYGIRVSLELFRSDSGKGVMA